MADWPPLRGASFLTVFPLYDGSGCLVVDATVSACVSTDGAAFGAAACSASQINAGAGVYKLPLDATEMTGDVVSWKVTANSASARPSIGVLYTAASRQLKDLAYPATAGRSLAVDANGQVNVAALAASAVGASQLAAGAVHAAAVAASTLTASKFGAAAIEAATLAASLIGSTKLATGAIVADVLGASVLTASKFGANAIHAAAVAASTLTASKLAANAIDAATVAASSLTSSEITDDALAQAWVAGTRTLTSLGASTITASTFGAGAIDGVALGASALTASKFAANAIHAAAVAASTLTGSKFGASFLEVGYVTNSAASHIGTVVRTGCALAEQGVGAPPATPTLEQSLMYPYMAWRNAASTTSGCHMITNDAGTVIAKAPTSDAASTFEKGEFVSG